MNRFTFAVLASACLFAAQRARAADLPVPFNHVEFKQVGNTYSWTPLTGPTPGGGGVIFRGDTSISTAEPKISTMQRLPFDKRGDVPASQMAKVTSPFTKAAFGKALMLAGKIAWPIGALMQAGEIVDFLKGFGIQDLTNTGGEIRGKIKYPTGYWTGPGGNSYPSAQAACSAVKPGTWTEQSPYYPNQMDCIGYVTGSTTLTGAWGSTTFVMQGEATELIEQQQIEEKIAQETAWRDAHARALQEALKVPGVKLETQTPNIVGPTSVPGSKTTATSSTQVAEGTTKQVPFGTPGAQPATVTTTTTTTNNAAYNGNQVTHNTTTSTVTNITNNIINQTDTTTDKQETKEDDQEEETPSDTPLGDLPVLYERKYPDGLTGIWNTKSAEIKQSPLFNLAEQLMPTGLTSGTCPSWRVDLGFGGGFGEYGLQDVSPPCWVWDIAKVIIIASALILARALVFGG